jgi:hypothetical protein
MSNPVFLFVMANGDLWFGNNRDALPSGTVTGIYHVNSDAKLQKLGSLSGTINSSLVASNSSTGFYGKQLT